MLYVADAAVNNCDKKACEFLTNISSIDQGEYPAFEPYNPATYIAMANAKDRDSSPIRRSACSGDGGICALIAQIQHLQATSDQQTENRNQQHPGSWLQQVCLKWAVGQAMAGTFLCGTNDFGMVQLIDCLIECIEP